MFRERYTTIVRYHPEHVWAKQDGDTWLTILTDFAQDQLGEVILSDLPAVDTHFEQGDSSAEIESAKQIVRRFFLFE